MRTTISTTVLAITLVSATMTPACCGLSGPGIEIGFATQQNIIIWNPETQTQHFIREAKFNTNAESMAFIAPTPSEPELGESNSDAYYVLSRLERFVRDYNRAKSNGDMTKSVESAAGSIDIIQTKDVAGYRATVIKASDAQALKTYLDENGFTPHDSFPSWADHYIQKDWYLTAFKVINKDQVAKTGVIRMTFQTDQPFNPYYVPKDNIDPNTSSGLDVFLVAPKPMTGTIGNDNSNKDWIKPENHILLPKPDRVELAKQLQIEENQIPQESTVTRFTDYNFAKSVTTDDVFFQDAPTAFIYSQAAIDSLKLRNKIPYILIIGSIVLLAIAIIFFTKKAEASQSK